jgi:hypothetical protein
MIGNANRGNGAIRFDPFMLFGVFAIRRIRHVLAPNSKFVPSLTRGFPVSRKT